MTVDGLLMQLCNSGELTKIMCCVVCVFLPTNKI